MALAFGGRFAAQDMIFGVDLRDLEIAVQDGAATLYAINGLNGGISRWQLAADGSLPQLAGQQLHGAASLRTGNFELAEIGGDLRLLQEQAGGGLSYYELARGGGLGGRQQDSLAGADAGGLGAMAVAALAGGGSAVYAAGAASGRLQGWRLDAEGRVQAQAGTGGSSAAYSLEPAALLAAVQTPGGPVLLAADGQGLRSFRADAASGALRPADQLGAAGGLAASGVSVLESFQAGGSSWALAGAAGSSSLSLVQVAADGALRLKAQFMDTAATRFGGISALETVEAEGHLLVLAAGNDGGLSLFTLTPGGALIHLESLAHEPGLGLQNVTALAAAAAGGMLQVFAASGAEGGISQFTLPLADLGDLRQAAAGAERLEGSGAGDVLEGGGGSADLYGHGGDDVLIAGAGGGVLEGGAGADVFVINPAAGRVTVRDFTPGEDRLDLSLFEGLHSAAQLQAGGRSTGMVMQAEDTVIVLLSADGSRLELADVFGPAQRFAFPERQEAGGTLPGGSFYGTGGRDRIAGTGGRDEIFGLGGGDRLAGGAGRDMLQGGGGQDALQGGRGNDVLKGGAGRDGLKGSGGGDRLQGGGGSDRLDGGRGADWLKGGGGADVFVFAGRHGRDSVADFTPGRDLLDLRGSAAQGLQDLALSRQDGGTLIGTGQGRIFLEDLQPGQLDADDFLF